MGRRAGLLGIVFVACVVWACGGKHDSYIAELTKADGPVEKQAGSGAWAGAPIGTKFSLGDAARTADTPAELKLGGSQLITMTPHTVLYFGGKSASNVDVSVKVGAIELVNTSNVALDIGNVKVEPNGKIRIGANDVTLLLGKAAIRGSDGTVSALLLNVPTQFEMDLGPAKLQDGGVVDASTPDAAVAVATDAAYEITGKKAEVQMPGETKFSPLPEGKGSLPKGAILRLGVGTKAKLTSNGVTLELAGGSRLKVGDNLIFWLELGNGDASVAAATEGKVTLPGGEVDLHGGASGATARIEINGKGEAKVGFIHGSGKLVGTGPNAGSLDIAAGENGTMLKVGTINPGVVIPKYFDFKVTAGETPNFTIHDPKGATAVQFFFAGKCPAEGVIEVDHDARFHTPRVSEGKDVANMLLPGGGWAYRLRCGQGGAAVASGRIVVVHDNGRRPLPPKPGKNDIDSDGRNYNISYQSLIPIVVVHYRGTGSSFKLHLATGGTEETFDSAKPVIEVPGKSLKEATYTFWVDHDGVKQDKVTTLKVTFDQTAAQVYIESPLDGVAFGADVEVAGAALPGWTAKVDAVEIPIVDTNTRRFKAKVPPPSGGALALAIRLSHPQRGIHYYLRRGAAAAPK